MVYALAGGRFWRHCWEGVAHGKGRKGVWFTRDKNDDLVHIIVCFHLGLLGLSGILLALNEY